MGNRLTPARVQQRRADTIVQLVREERAASTSEEISKASRLLLQHGLWREAVELTTPTDKSISPGDLSEAAGDLIIKSYDVGVKVSPSLRAILQNLWRSKKYHKAYALSKAVAKSEPLISELYALHYAIYAQPNSNLLGRALELLKTAEEKRQLDEVRGAHLLVFDYHIRWASIDELVAFFETYRSEIILDTMRSGTLAAAYLKRLVSEKRYAAALQASADLLVTEHKSFASFFRLRSIETTIAAKNYLAVDDPRAGTGDAYDLYQREAVSSFNQAVGRFWQDLHRFAETRGETYFNIRVDEDERDLLLIRVKNALKQGVPISCIRIGDGESYGFGTTALESLDNEIVPPLLERTAQIFEHDHPARELVWWGDHIDTANKEVLRSEIESAILNADIIGTPNIYRLCRDLRPSPFHEEMQGRGLCHALIETAGLLRKRQDTFSVADERFNHVFTSDVVAHLAEISRRVVVVGPYPESDIVDKLSLSTPLKIIQIPPHTRIRQAIEEGKEAPGTLPTIAMEIAESVTRESEAGVLVLIAAGIWGKVFANKARSQGAVALDLGSAVDYWMDVKSRSALDAT
ncbi:MAG: hypothetical protein AAF292_10705 [Pseudomonadota bacterium]